MMTRQDGEKTKRKGLVDSRNDVGRHSTCVVDVALVVLHV